MKRSRRFAGDDDLIVIRPAPKQSSEEITRPRTGEDLDPDDLKDDSKRP